MKHPRVRNIKRRRPRKSENEESTPIAHLRSSKGRRPPFYPLNPSRPIDQVPIDELELGDIAALEPYEDGTAQTQGIRAWNEEHEAILRWTYAPGSPCLIDPTEPNQHSSYITEVAVSSRHRGRVANEQVAAGLHLFFSTPDGQKCRTLWKTLSTEEQEERILEALASLARADEYPGNPLAHEGFVRRNRRLTPEITLSSLCADSGDGFLRWLDLLEEYTKDGTKLGERPIPHRGFFAKFGIPLDDASPSIPLSMSDRAFIDEHLLRRHSLLFQFTQSLMLAILGVNEDRIKRSKVGNIRSEITSDNDPFLADKGEFGESGPLPKTYGYFCDEECSLCHKTAEESDTARLLYCARCKKVGRVHPYCSNHCQKLDWMHHREEGHCGSKLSDFLSTPVAGESSSRAPTASTSTYSDLSILRQSVLKSLDRRPDAMWAVPSGQPPLLLFHIENDNATEVKLRQQVRGHAYKALKESHQPSICLLARAVVKPTYTSRGHSSSPEESSDNETITEDEVRVGFDVREHQFREMFDLEDDPKWVEALEAGEVELNKEENELLKRFAVSAFKQRDARDSKSGRSQILDRITPTFSEDTPPEMTQLARFFMDVALGPRNGSDNQDQPLPESNGESCIVQ